MQIRGNIKIVHSRNTHIHTDILTIDTTEMKRIIRKSKLCSQKFDSLDEKDNSLNSISY